MDFIQNSRQRHVILSGSSMVGSIDYRKALEFHQKNGADITILYKEQTIGADDFSQCTALDVSETGVVTDIKINQAKITGNKISMEMYILERSLLIDLVDICIAHGGTDFVKDILIKNLSNMRIYGYQHRGYLARIHSIQSYYKHSLDLLKPEIWQELFLHSGGIYTKVKDGPPAKYQESADVHNTLVATGCIVEGRVENSILFRDVKVSKGAVIKNSIIMQKTQIGEYAIVENVICDKDVRVTKGKRLQGELTYPLVIKKGIVI
jgi:glucose-1-phosphate adenylyltransferase